MSMQIITFFWYAGIVHLIIITIIETYYYINISFFICLYKYLFFEDIND